MASRTSNPAQFVSTGTTENNSRGGLFVQSNLANNVSGFVVPTVTVNDATVTIFQNDGTTEVASFTLNQADDVNIILPTGTSGDPNNPLTVIGVTILDRVLTFMHLDGTSTTITIPDGGGTVDLGPLEARVTALEAINAVLTVNSQAPDAAGNVDVDVTLEVGNGTEATAATMMLSGLVINPDTGFQVVELSDGTFVFQRIPTAGPSTPATRNTILTPPPGDIFGGTPDVIPMTTITGGGVTPGTTPTTTVTLGGNPITVQPGPPSINGDRTVVTTTIDGTTVDSPGDYEVTTTIRVTPTDTTSPPTTITERETFTRFVPYYVVRTEPMDESMLAALMPEATEFDPASFTTPDGTGAAFLIIDSTIVPNTADRAFGDVRGFPVTWERRTRPGGPTTSIIRTDANNTSYTYDIYRANIIGSEPITNFRVTA